MPSRSGHIQRALAATSLALLMLAGCGKSREEELEAERSKGAEMVEDKAAMVKGVGQALQDDGKKAVAELSTGLGKMVSGVAEGVDRAKEVAITADASATGLSLQTARAVMELGESQGQNVLKAYVQCAKAAAGQLHLRAFDADGREVGRSNRVDEQFADDDARYVRFEFDSATPMNRVSRFVLYATGKG